MKATGIFLSHVEVFFWAVSILMFTVGIGMVLGIGKPKSKVISVPSVEEIKVVSRSLIFILLFSKRCWRDVVVNLHGTPATGTPFLSSVLILIVVLVFLDWMSGRSGTRPAGIENTTS